MVNSASIMKKITVGISILLCILICFRISEVSGLSKPLSKDNSALGSHSAVHRGRISTSTTTGGTSHTTADDAQAIKKNIKDIKHMESAANNNHANREEIIMRRAANEDISEHPGIEKKFPSNLKLKSLLKDAIKRGRDTAASQGAPGSDIPKHGIPGKTGQKSSGRDNKKSHQPDDHPRIKGSVSEPRVRGTSTEQEMKENTQPTNMASAEPRWRSAMDYGLKSHNEKRRLKRRKKTKGRLESQSETKDSADNGTIVGGLIGGMFLFMAIGAVFYRIWKNCRKRIGRDGGDPERGRLSASNQAIAEDRDEDIIFERKPKGWKKNHKKEDKEDSPGEKVQLNSGVSQSPPPKGILKGGHGREVRVNMEASDSSQPTSLSSMSAPSPCSSFGTPHSTPTIGPSMEYITLIDSRKDSYLRVLMPQMQSSGSSSSSDMKIKVEPEENQVAPPQSLTISAACRQLTSIVTTETGGSNSSSESCKTPVAVSNDVIITINDDDDCKVPLLSSENEGSSAEVIYVRNDLITEATEGDGNDVKERPGEPPLPPDQAKPPSDPTDVEKATSHQLTSIVGTETGGSNSSSESYKTPVAASNDVITKIDDDDDCKVPLLSSENEGSSAEVIYVKNDLTTEATVGDEIDVKERSAACSQLTNIVSTETGGFNATSESCKIPVTVSNNVMVTIDGDDDCIVPLLSSENEGSYAEVIYVKNDLTTEVTMGDGNDVKERPAACRQLTNIDSTETGGFNASSESCKTPVTVSNDVIVTIYGDDDCKAPLMSSENEGLSAEVIYVKNDSITEVAVGDGNDVKERPAASPQLTSDVITETGGSNSSSESCKTPVAVSNDIIVTIDGDNDCKVPLLSSENEGSSSEVIYVRKDLTTEATEGDKNNVKERSGKSPIGGHKALEDHQLTHLTSGQNSEDLHEDPNKAVSQTLVRNQLALNSDKEKRRVIKERTKMTVNSLEESVLLAKSIILDEAIDKARDFECMKRRRIIRKGLSLRSDTSLSEGITLAQSVILPTPVDPKKIKRDTERLKVNKELLKNCVNPSFADVIQVVASTIRSDVITRDLRKQNDYKRYLIAVDAKSCAVKNEKPTFKMDIQFVRNVICGRSSLDHGENPEMGCLCSYCVKQRSKTWGPDSGGPVSGGSDCSNIPQNIPATDDTFVIGGKVFTIFVPKQSSSGNAGPGTSTGSDTAHTE